MTERVSRRKYIAVAGAAAAAAVIGGAAYYLSQPGPSAPTPTPKPTATPTPTKTPTPTATPKPTHPTGTPKLTITYWQYDCRPGDRAGAYAVAYEFMKRNPNIEIELEFVPWEIAQGKIMSALEAGNYPDTQQGWWLVQSHIWPHAVEIDDYVKEWRKEHPDELFDVVWDMLDVQVDAMYYVAEEKEHHFFGMPWFGGYEPVLYVNMKILKENGLTEEDIPKTWDEVREVAVKCTKPPEYWGIEFIGAGIGQPWWMVRYHLQSWGVDFVEEVDGKWRVGFDNKEGLEALKDYFDFALKYKCTPPSMVTDTYKDVANMFGTGRLAMVTGIGPWTLKSWIETLGEDLYIAPAPKGPGGPPKIGVTICPVMPLDTKNTLENKDEIFKWVSFWSTYDGQKLWFDSGGCGLSPNRRLMKEWSEDPKLSKWYKTFYEGWSNATKETVATRMPPCITLFGDANTIGYLQSVLTGEMSVEEFHQKLVSLVREQLKEGGVLAE